MLRCVFAACGCITVMDSLGVFFAADWGVTGRKLLGVWNREKSCARSLASVAEGELEIDYHL